MNPDAVRAYFRIGVWITLVAMLLVLTIPREKPEFIISVCSLGIGLTLMTLTAVLRRFLR